MCGVLEDAEHFIFNCNKYISEREKLETSLRNVNINLNDISITDLLGLRNMNKYQQSHTHLSLIEYVLSTNRHLEGKW